MHPGSAFFNSCVNQRKKSLRKWVRRLKRGMVILTMRPKAF